MLHPPAGGSLPPAPLSALGRGAIKPLRAGSCRPETRNTISARITPGEGFPTAEAAGPYHRSCSGNQQQVSRADHLAVDGIPVDQAALTNYALVYIASVIVVFLLFLPFILGYFLLLLVAAAVQFAALLGKVVILGTRRALAGLSRNGAGRVPGGGRPDGLVPR